MNPERPPLLSFFLCVSSADHVNMAQSRHTFRQLFDRLGIVLYNSTTRDTSPSLVPLIFCASQPRNSVQCQKRRRRFESKFSFHLDFNACSALTSRPVLHLGHNLKQDCRGPHPPEMTLSARSSRRRGQRSSTSRKNGRRTGPTELPTGRWRFHPQSEKRKAVGRDHLHQTSSRRPASQREQRTVHPSTHGRSPRSTGAAMATDAVVTVTIPPRRRPTSPAQLFSLQSSWCRDDKRLHHLRHQVPLQYRIPSRKMAVGNRATSYTRRRRFPRRLPAQMCQSSRSPSIPVAAQLPDPIIGAATQSCSR